MFLKGPCRLSGVFTPAIGRLSGVFTPAVGRLSDVFTPTAHYKVETCRSHHLYMELLMAVRGRGHLKGILVYTVSFI